MSTQRDELATIINDNEVADGGRWTTYPHVTAAAVLEAGYRKPRTVTTAEELDALPQWSAILDSQGDVAQKLNGWWHFPETAKMGASEVIKYGSVTVIHEPAA